MTTTLALAGLVAYALVSAFICVQLNNGAHWWCPLCALLRLLARRIR